MRPRPVHLHIHKWVVSDIQRVGNLSEECAYFCALFALNLTSCTHHYNERHNYENTGGIVDTIEDAVFAANTRNREEYCEDERTPPKTILYLYELTNARDEKTDKEWVEESSQTDINLFCIKTPTANDGISVCSVVGCQ